MVVSGNNNISLAPAALLLWGGWFRAPVGVKSYAKAPALAPFIDEDGNIIDEARCEDLGATPKYHNGEREIPTCTSYTERLSNDGKRENFMATTRTETIVLHRRDVENPEVWARILFPGAQPDDYELLAGILSELNPDGLTRVTTLGAFSGFFIDTLYNSYQVMVPRFEASPTGMRTYHNVESKVKRYLDGDDQRLIDLVDKAFTADLTGMATEDAEALRALRAAIQEFGDQSTIKHYLSNLYYRFCLVESHDEQSQTDGQLRYFQYLRYATLHHEIEDGHIYLLVDKLVEFSELYDAALSGGAVSQVLIEDATPEPGDDDTTVAEEEPSPASDDDDDVTAEEEPTPAPPAADDITDISVRLAVIGSNHQQYVDLMPRSAGTATSFRDPSKILHVWCTGDVSSAVVEPCEFTEVDGNGFLDILVTTGEYETGSITFNVRYKKYDGRPDGEQPVFSTRLPLRRPPVEEPTPPPPEGDLTDGPSRAAPGKLELRREDPTPADGDDDDTTDAGDRPLTDIEIACRDKGAIDLEACARECSADYDLRIDNPDLFVQCAEDK